MTFNKKSQLALVSAAALAISGLLSACLVTNTADFLFVASSKAVGSSSYGQIDVMEVNAQSGSLRSIPTAPFPSQGRNPVAMATSPDHNYLYVVNHDDNTIVQFYIGNDGKLYAQSTINTPGIYPVALAVDPSQSYLYVLDTYQPLATCSTNAPCSGSVAAFPIATGKAGQLNSSGVPAGSLGSAIYNGLGLNYYPVTLTESSDIVAPKSIAVSSDGKFIYVGAEDATASNGYIFSYAVNSGVIAPTGSSFYQQIGTTPASIVASASSSTVFVADAVNLANATEGANIFSFTINSDGSLNLAGGYAAGNQPVSLALDKTGKFLYAANATDGNISAFAVSGAALTAFGTYSAGSQPSAIIVDPNLGAFVYAANYNPNGSLGTVSGYELNSAGNGLTATVNTPYSVNVQPTAVAAIPHSYNK